jgi:ribose transport system substrate-binding protein
MKYVLGAMGLVFLALSVWIVSARSGAESFIHAMPRYAFVTNGVDPFWTIAEVGAKKAAAELRAQPIIRTPGTAQDQKQTLEDLVTSGVDGIALTPIDPENQTALLDQIAARTLLITHDSDAPKSKRRVFVGMDNYDAGRLLGQMVRQEMPQGGKVMIFVGRLEQDNGRLRRQGVIDELLQRPHDRSNYDPPQAVLEGGGFKIAGTRTDQFDRSVAKANASDGLTAHPDMAAMIGLFAFNPPAILGALRQADKLGKVKVFGFDEDQATLQGILDGTVVGTVVQDPYNYGYRSIQVLHALKNGDTKVIPDSGRIEVPARQITRANVEAFWSDLKQKLGK